MRSRTIASVFCVVALGFGAGAGCGGDPDKPAELAELSPPPPGTTERAKGLPLPKTPPKFGAPPRSQMVPPAKPGQ
jgi:hypothetical protein